MANGIPISSVLEYLFPIDCPVSSTLQVNKHLFILSFNSLMISPNLASFCNGKIDTLTGAILGFKTKYVLFSSLTLKVCYNMHDMILPRPNDGSMTLGVYFSSITLTIFCSNWTCYLASLKSVPLAFTVMNPSVSNLVLSSAFNYSWAFYKCEMIAWESFLNYFPITFLSKTTDVWSYGLAYLNLLEAISLVPEPKVWWVKS